MNRAQRRAIGVTTGESVATMTITAKQLDTHMPHVKDGDVIGIRGKKYRVRVVPEKDQVVH